MYLLESMQDIFHLQQKIDVYKRQAQTLIDRRGQNKDQRNTGYNGGTYSQDATPFVNETNAVGHSVRANYYYTGITDIATLLPESDETRAKYINSLDTIWNSVTEKKTYITGGIGTTTAGSSAEGYGNDYDLPPDQSYCCLLYTSGTVCGSPLGTSVFVYERS